MEIDRKRFLALVSAIGAQTACGAAQPDPAPIHVAIEPVPTAPSATPEPARRPLAPAPSQPVAVDPPPAPAATSAGIWALSPLDPPRSCAQLRCPLGAPWQEAFRVLQHDCKGLEASLRPDAFQRFMACMIPQNGTRATCDLTLVGTDPGLCLERWSEPPVLDAATAAKCKPIVQRCNGPRRSPHAGAGSLTLEACQGILSVTKPNVESKMIHCITEYCDDAPRLCYMTF